MKVNSVNNSLYTAMSSVNLPEQNSSIKYVGAAEACSNQPKDCLSFKGGKIGFTKRFWLMFRKLSDYMKEPSEMTNAEIAAIGTGAIAPFAIMCSPKNKKKNTSEEDKKVEKEKKFFQALRQPVSAALAFGFQVPTTIGIAMGFNHLAYKKHWKFFNDDILGHLIPDKKYLACQAKSVLKGSANAQMQENWKEELKLVADRNAMKQELIEQLKKEDAEVGIEASPDKLEKRASKEKTLRKFIAEKMAKAKHDKLLEEKVKELTDKKIEFTDTDLVTEDYQNLAKQRYKSEFEALKKEHKLSAFDQFIKAMGISNKRIGALDDAEKELAKKKGLEILKAEKPEIFSGDKLARLKKFIENRDAKSQKLYKNKIFWLTLVTNLFMVAISCVALNWLHPKFADVVDKFKDKRANHNSEKAKKAEVRA